MRLGQRVAAATKAAIGIFSDNALQEAYGMLGGILPGGVGSPPTRGTAEYLRAYSQMPWLRAVAGRVATSVASTEWQLFVLKNGKMPARMDAMVKRLQRADLKQRRTLMKAAKDEGELVQVTDHPMLNALHNANSFQTGQGMRKVTQLHLDLVGEAFWLKERIQGGPLDGLVAGVWPVPPNWILATPTPTFRYFRVGFRGWRGNIPDTEFVWFSDPDPANPYGRGSGTAMSLADELETDEYTAKHLKAFFYNRARPDLIIWPKDGNANPAATQRLEQDWLARTQGFWRSFKPYFMTRPIEVKELEQNFRQLALVPLREFERDAILQVFGMPPEVLGVLTNSNRATIDSADYLMNSYVVVPRLEFIRGVLQERLAPEYDERLIVDYPSPIKEDEAEQLNAAKAAPWALSLDEWRARTGHAPMDDPDAGALHFVLGTGKMTTVDEMLNPPEPPPQLAPFAGKPPANPDDSPGMLPGSAGSETPPADDGSKGFAMYRLAAKGAFDGYAVGDSFTDEKAVVAMTSLSEATRAQRARKATRVKITADPRDVQVRGLRAMLPPGRTFEVVSLAADAIEVRLVGGAL